MPAIPPRPGTVAREEAESGVPARGVDDLRAEGEPRPDDLARGWVAEEFAIAVAEVAATQKSGRPPLYTATFLTCDQAVGSRKNTFFD